MLVEKQRCDLRPAVCRQHKVRHAHGLLCGRGYVRKSSPKGLVQEALGEAVMGQIAVRGDLHAYKGHAKCWIAELNFVCLEKQ